MNVEQVKSIDEAMGLAIEHSYQVKGTTYPKPPVGAVIVDPNGRIVGAGGQRENRVAIQGGVCRPDGAGQPVVGGNRDAPASRRAQRGVTRNHTDRRIERGVEGSQRGR